MDQFGCNKFIIEIAAVVHFTTFVLCGVSILMLELPVCRCRAASWWLFDPSVPSEDPCACGAEHHQAVWGWEENNREEVDKK